MNLEADSKRRNQILSVLFLGVLMGALDIAIVGPALPAIQSYFHVNERTLAWMFTVYVLFNLVGTPLMARLSDLYGRRSIYVLDVVLFGIGSAVVAFSPAFWVVLLGRAIQGFGAGGIFPIASAVIGDTFPVEKRGSALGLIGAVFGLAFLIGPILGGVLLRFSWHWLFLINLPVALVVILLSLRLLPKSHPEDRPVFDWQGMLLLAGALALLAYGLNQIDTTNFLKSLLGVSVLPFLILAAVLGFWLARVEKRSPEPILKPNLFSTRQMKLAYVLSAGAGFGETGVVFMPLLAVAALNVNDRQASFLLLAVVVALAFGSPMSGRLLDRLGSKVVILGGTAVAALGFFLLALLSTSLIGFIGASVLLGLGLSALLGAPLRYILLNEAGADERSAAQGVIAVFTSIGELVGSALIGGLAYSFGSGVRGYSAAFILVAGIFVILALTALFLKTRHAEMATARETEDVAKGEAINQPAGTKARDEQEETERKPV